jgi:hypothetical protein
MYQYSSFHTYVDCHVTKSKVQAGAVTLVDLQGWLRLLWLANRGCHLFSECERDWFLGRGLSGYISLFVGADGPNRRTVKRMCVSECIVVVVQSVFYLRIG